VNIVTSRPYKRILLRDVTVYANGDRGIRHVAGQSSYIEGLQIVGGNIVCDGTDAAERGMDFGNDARGGWIFHNVNIKTSGATSIGIRAPSTGACVISGCVIDVPAGRIPIQRNAANQNVFLNTFVNGSLAGNFLATDNLRGLVEFNYSLSTSLTQPARGECARMTAPLSGSSVALPTVGTWLRGDGIRASLPSAASAPAAICTVSGTYGTLSAVTGDTTNGSPVVVVNNASDLTVGTFITVTGAGLTRVRIIAISGTSVTVSSNATSTQTGAAVSFEPPIWKQEASLSI
jgi:hypothetical protein